MPSVSKIFVTYASPYEISDSNQRGVSVNYYFWGEKGETLKAALKHPGQAGGLQRAKVSLPYEADTLFRQVPGIYEGGFEMAVGSDGKPVMKLIDIKFANEIVELKAVPFKEQA